MSGMTILSVIGERMASIQSHLNFDRWEEYPQFACVKGLGRVALLASFLGISFGIHATLFVQLAIVRLGLISFDVLNNLSDDVLQMATQWTVYIICLCTFHLGEFFTTVMFNPTEASSDSFMVNHSKAYTAAALISWVEFFLRILFFPAINSSRLFHLGIVCVLVGQTVRSLAMVTCGESFNHFIQRDKKDTHVLVTHGIYKYLRHPSYFGFFYWAVGTQLVLGNPVSSTLYALAAWTFFRHRITYEEDTLCHLFPGKYEAYAATSYIGIPFVQLFCEDM